MPARPVSTPRRQRLSENTEKKSRRTLRARRRGVERLLEKYNIVQVRPTGRAIRRADKHKISDTRRDIILYVTYSSVHCSVLPIVYADIMRAYIADGFIHYTTRRRGQAYLPRDGGGGGSWETLWSSTRSRARDLRRRFRVAIAPPSPPRTKSLRVTNRDRRR